MKQKSFKKLLTIAFAVIASSSEAAAQDGAIAPTVQNVSKFSIEALVAEALEKNPEHEFYRAEISAAKAERKQAGAYPNPDLSLEGGRKRAYDPSGMLAGEGMAWTVSVAQPLDFPGRIALRKAIANQQVELAELGLRQFQATLVTSVKALAYKVHAAQAQAEAASQFAHRSQELIETLVQRDPAGIAPLLETRLIEASIITFNNRATEALIQARNLIAELNLLRGQPLDAAIQIVDPKLDFPTLPAVETLVDRVSSNNFDVLAQQIDLAQQGLRVDLTKKDRWKEVTVAPFYSQEKAGDQERIVGLGVSIPVPLWNRNTGNIRAASARQQQAEVAVHLVQRRVERQIRERVVAYNARVEQMSRWRPDTLASLREAAELADRHYRLGAVPITTYIELQEKYLEAQETILNTQTEALVDLHQISLATGDFSIPSTISNR